MGVTDLEKIWDTISKFNHLEAKLQLWGVKNKTVDLKYIDALKSTSI